MILPEIVTVGIYDSRIFAKNTVISKSRKTTMFEIELPIEGGGIAYIDASSKRDKLERSGHIRHFAQGK